MDTIKNQIAKLGINELIEAMHAHGIVTAGRYAAANAIATDRLKCERELLAAIEAKNKQP